ncbi:MAG: ATP-binding cassette domain-containing protein [Rhodospirillaceae bacterium]|nr:ATP-binding cassette domain-containing protein [Rhodospirillaceae bacterium]
MPASALPSPRAPRKSALPSAAPRWKSPGSAPIAALRRDSAVAEKRTLAAVRGITLTHAGTPILEHVDLAVRAGELVSLIGPNGSGKTTLVRILLGLAKPDGGTVERRPGLRIGYVPQRLVVDRTMPITAERFLSLAPRGGKAERAAALAELGIERLADRAVQHLSGGEFQRLLLARALLAEPELLVMDEPAQGVDVSGQAELYRWIAGLRDRRGCGVLLVSHDLHLVMAATDTVVCLNRHVCCTGHPEAVARHPEYLALFGTAAAGFAVYAHHHDHVHDLAGEVHAEGEHRHHHHHDHAH